MTIDAALRALDDAVSRDDWEACDTWAAERLEGTELPIAAGCVAAAMDRDRGRRAQSIEEGTGDGLIEPQRRMFQGIVRLWSIASRGGAVEEVDADADATYGLLVGSDRPVLLAVSCRRDAIVAADASAATTARQRRQLFAVLGALAYVATDGARVGRSFGLEVGTVNHVELRSGTARLLASRWHVDRGADLARWLDGPDVVSVRPAGGRLALAPYVVQLEQAADRLFKKAFAAKEGILPPGMAWCSEQDLDKVLDAVELVEGWGWTDVLEPLRPRTAELVARVRAGAPAEEIERWLVVTSAEG